MIVPERKVPSMNLDLVQIGNFIQNCRKELGLTQAEVGERLCVSPQSVSNWERGETLPDVSLLPDLACMLRCSASKESDKIKNLQRNHS